MRFLRSEAGAVVLWVGLSLVLAAVFVPWLYAGGQWLAVEAAAGRSLGILGGIADSARRADFGRYFNRALMISALALMPVLIHRLRSLKAAREPTSAGRRRVPWNWAVGQVALGLLIAGALLWVTGSLLEGAGAFTTKSGNLSVGRWFSKAVVPAIGASLVEEWVFRGLLLGVWLRVAKPLAACLGTSLIFAFVHFLEPPGADLEDPSSPVAGFIALGRILLNFVNPMFFVTEFATYLLVGLILALARIRTGALWFSIGLHAGWVLAFKSFNLLHRHVRGNDLSPLGVGENLLTGVFPLLTLVLTAVVCHLALRKMPLSPGTLQP